MGKINHPRTQEVTDLIKGLDLSSYDLAKIIIAQGKSNVFEVASILIDELPNEKKLMLQDSCSVPSKKNFILSGCSINVVDDGFECEGIFFKTFSDLTFGIKYFNKQLQN